MAERGASKPQAWLAGKGWTATGADVSATAVQKATQRAWRRVWATKQDFQQHDLAVSFPAGEFDLVTALFFQSPVDFPRASVLQRAAVAVAQNGLLLIVEHASAAPWSWSPEAGYPTVGEPWPRSDCRRLPGARSLSARRNAWLTGRRDRRRGSQTTSLPSDISRWVWQCCRLGEPEDRLVVAAFLLGDPEADCPEPTPDLPVGLGPRVDHRENIWPFPELPAIWVTWSDVH